MKTLGRHLIAEFYHCDRDILNDIEILRETLCEAARLIDATVLGHSFHRFSPVGVSGAVVIAESHLSIHTWPEKGYAAIDIYTCGGLDPRAGFEHIGAVVRADSYRQQEIVRGLPEDMEDDRVVSPADVQVITEAVTEHKLRHT